MTRAWAQYLIGACQTIDAAETASLPKTNVISERDFAQHEEAGGTRRPVAFYKHVMKQSADRSLFALSKDGKVLPLDTMQGNLQRLMALSAAASRPESTTASPASSSDSPDGEV